MPLRHVMQLRPSMYPISSENTFIMHFEFNVRSYSIQNGARQITDTLIVLTIPAYCPNKMPKNASCPSELSYIYILVSESKTQVLY